MSDLNQSYDAVIGVWDGHDAGAALIIDGRVVLALNEERLSGRKLDVGMPVRAIAAMRTASAGLRVAWAPTTSDPAKTLTRLFPSMKENYYRLRRRETARQIHAHPMANTSVAAGLDAPVFYQRTGRSHRRYFPC